MYHTVSVKVQMLLQYVLKMYPYVETDVLLEIVSSNYNN
jgi:hypothetical protein